MEDLLEAEEPISTKSATCHFIFTLGSEFEAIQHNYRIGNLPPEWKTQNWPTLLMLCRNYSHSVNPQGLPKCDSTPKIPTNNGNRAHHHKKIRQWFLNPEKYKSELAAEQQKHEGKCVYHLTDTHTTETCSIKKECDHIVSQRSLSNIGPTSPVSGHFCNVKEDVIEESVPDKMPEMHDPDCNDTNDANLFYFVRMRNHYLCLVKSTPSMQSRHKMKYPMIADSGANFHMCRLPHDQNKLQDTESATSFFLPLDFVCRHVTQVEEPSTLLNKSETNILKSLRDYYAEIKTKRQLNHGVPAGFLQHSTLQKDFWEFLPPCKLRNTAESSILKSDEDIIPSLK